MPQAWPAEGDRAVTIGGDDEVFHQRVARSLDKLNATVAGHELLAALANRRAGIQGPARNVGILRTGENNECRSLYRDGGAGSDARTLLAQALIDGVGSIPDQITASLAAMGYPGNYDWLATSVNISPIYILEGMPSINQSRFGLTAEHVQDWVNEDTTYPAPFSDEQRDDLTKLLLTVLWPGSRTSPGAGVHSQVRWNPTRNQITLTTGKVLRASKTVSLAHELTHALYNGDGRQLGNESGDPSTVLYEYMAVGLGPWVTEPCSENKYRAEWTKPKLKQRPCY